MKIHQFEHLPGGAQLWIYGLDARITPEVREKMGSDLDAFVDSWQSHGEPVDGAAVVSLPEGR